MEELLLARYIDWNQLIQRGELRQLKCVITIGLALDIVPLPGFLIWVANQYFVAFTYALVMDPATDRAGLDHHKVRPVVLQQFR